MRITKDAANNALHITREFAAPVAHVWRAWTESRLLDQWWAPKPWRAETKSMDFKEGGYWLYCMVGPEGERHWARVDYNRIVSGKSFDAIDSFCDQEGIKSPEMPSMKWKNVFSPNGNRTTVEVTIHFNTAADQQKIVEMGFESGFAAALNNLDELLAKGF